MKLSGARLLLTGASGGLGQALATALVEQGAQLVLSGRRMETLHALAERLQPRHGTRPEVLQADLRQPDDLRKLALRCRSRTLPIDGLILNAGVNVLQPFELSTPASMTEVLGVDLHAPMWLVHAALPALLERPAARVLLVNSTLGRLGHPGYVAYCAAKHGLRGFAEALRRELAGTSVRIQELYPRAMRTSMNDAGADALNAWSRAAVDAPEAIAARAVRQLLRDEARVLIGAPERWFMRLNQWFPSLLDRALGRRWPAMRQVALQARAAPQPPPDARSTHVATKEMPT